MRLKQTVVDINGHDSGAVSREQEITVAEYLADSSSTGNSFFFFRDVYFTLSELV